MADSSLSAGVSANPYASPAAQAVGSDSSSGDRQIDELATFVGPSKAAYYLKQWRPLLAGVSQSTKVNWAAFFLAGFWLAYRKMYRQAAVFYGVMISIGVVEFLAFDLAMGQELPPLADRAISIGVAAVCGIYANRWYLQHAQRQIADVRAQVPAESRRGEIARRGGTNFIFALGFNVLALAVLVAVFAVIGVLIGIVAPEALDGPEAVYTSEY